MSDETRGLIPREQRFYVLADGPLDAPFEAFLLGQQVDEAIANGEFAQAQDLAEAELATLRAAEIRTKRRLHKGHPLYSLGVVEFARAPVVGRRYILAAHVEDARTWPTRRPRGAVAARVLGELFRLPKKLLASLARQGRADDRYALDLVEVFEADNPLPPVPFAVVPAGSRDTRELAGETKSRLVFVGGNYSKSIDRIYNAREVVQNAGFVPVLVREFRTEPSERERSKSFRLLDLCPSALFEASEAGGWVPEFERLVYTRPNTPTLLVFPAEAPDREHPSKMLPDTSDMPRLAIRPYGSAGDMKYEVLRWLQSVGNSKRPASVPTAPRERPPAARTGPVEAPQPSTTIMPRNIALPGTAVIRPPTSPRDHTGGE